jgi:hypothetical protein
MFASAKEASLAGVIVAGCCLAMAEVDKAPGLGHRTTVIVNIT